MVVLTIGVPSNEHTMYFKEPISKPNYVWLLCCLLYNSWYNLKCKGEISVTTVSDDKATAANIAPGYYTSESMATGIQNTLAKQNVELPIATNRSLGSLVIFNPENKYAIGLSNNLRLTPC